MLIDGRTTLCGLFGCPVEHSFSPLMHNTAFKYLKLNWAYVPFKVEPHYLSQALSSIRALNLAGVNITVPHKEAVLSHLDELTPDAVSIGAVNVILNKEGKLVGDNTDGRGFIRSLKEEAGLIPAGKKAVILGAGGAAKAAAVQLAVEGVKEVSIINRTPAKAEVLAGAVQKLGPKSRIFTWETSEAAVVINEADLVVQCTSIGMYPDVNRSVPVPEDVFHSGQVVYDLIYNPLKTKFLKMAETRGANVVGGLGMLLYQGALAFELWTGTAAPVDVMREALQKQIRER